jgi:hypothetical protein
MLKRALITLFLIASPALANDIYIQQIGDSLDLDIIQDGQNNSIGNSTTGVTFEGDSMTFSITQTGNYNEIAAIIKGNTYTGTWDFTGDYNIVDLTCDSTTGTNCEAVTLNIDTTGDSNEFNVYIGETADAQNLVANFTVTGDNSIITADVDGKNADITVTMDNSASLATSSANGDEGNVLTITQDGDGDVNGHSITLGITGGGSTYDITQSGIYDNTIDATFSGDGQDVDITQSD